MKIRAAHRNSILRGLPEKVARLLMPHLQPLILTKNFVLYEAGQPLQQVYFPDQALISCRSRAMEGASFEVCTIGHEGVVGLSGILSERTLFRAVVQIPGRAYALDSSILRRELGRGGSLQELLLRYMGRLVAQLSQAAVCCNFHSIEQRFVRWLLAARDHTGSDSIPMTQDTMAGILGSRRASVSAVAASLQKKCLLEYRRGVIRIRDAGALELQACACYRTLATAHR